MSRIKYRELKMSVKNKHRLILINRIIEEYQEKGYTLTLRQLYYQLVSRDIIPNQKKEYNKLSILLKEGRMAGIVDWSAIEDRLRKPESPSCFDSPEDVLNAAISQYQIPRMGGQRNYLEVWVEKDALSGVLSRVTRKYHIPIMVNRGYSSVSAMHEAFKRFRKAAIVDKQEVSVLYLGDFDPSGKDMIRDIEDRIIEFIEGDKGAFEFNVEVIPIALTAKQINVYNPPPNPAKITDPRATEYIAKYGDKSWEVDALRPEVLDALLELNIKKYIDLDLYNEKLEKEKLDKLKLFSLKEHL